MSPSQDTPPLHLAVSLDGAGAHPAAWREPGARPRGSTTARYWAELVAEAEAGLLDFVTFEDSLGPRSADPTGPARRADLVRGRLDSVLTAARVAPVTRHVGLVPTVTVTHAEPFHVAHALATLDHVSGGRAGLNLQVSERPDETPHFGRRDPLEPLARLLEEAADHAEVVRRLWDRREDETALRGVPGGPTATPGLTGGPTATPGLTGGPTATPGLTGRPTALRIPQGRPPVGVLAADPARYGLLAGAADIGYVTPRDAEQVRAAVRGILPAREEAGRAGDPLHLFGELTVFLDGTAEGAERRLRRLDSVYGTAYASAAPIFAGTPTQLADRLLEWRRAGLSGFRLRPGVLAHDLPGITRALVPELQWRGAFRRGYEASTLRGLLGLRRPAGRYARSTA
ncbi:LLM class flavin-dependent oxidoreductase [Streptomyces sp. NPDC088097]|uniref:LLM class flavin-dependent oxidoreductase n=1 Tax=Streptomyces sp. NPDC088097 TaxID=3365823 RepID=UPI003806FD08